VCVVCMAVTEGVVGGDVVMVVMSVWVWSRRSNRSSRVAFCWSFNSLRSSAVIAFVKVWLSVQVMIWVVKLVIGKSCRLEDVEAEWHFGGVSTV